MTAPFGGGADAHLRVDVDADASAAAKHLSDALSKAIAAAMKSKTVQNAISDIVKAMSKGADGFAKSTEKGFKDATRQGQRFADSLVKQFDRVREAAQKAFDFGAARGSHPTMQTLNASVVSLMGNLDHLGTVSRRAMQAIEQAMLNARAATAAASSEARNQATVSAQSDRLRIAQLQKESATIRAAGELQTATVKAHGQQVLAVYRGITRVVSAAWKTADRAVTGFVHGAGSALRGLAHTTASTFRGMERAASASFRAMSSAFRGFGRGLTTALTGVSRAFQAAFRRDEQALTSSLHRREAAMRGSQSRMSGLLSGGMLGGLAGGAGIGSLLTAGFERFGEQERLQLTFEALLRDGPKATSILADISDFARTTSFDFVEVAGSVAQFTATLGDVDQAFDMTKFLADITALTGGTTESLGRVRLAMTQIASAGRLDAANLKQLTESLPGVPFAQILADKFFGGDVQAYSAARDAGELGATISAEAFFDAFRDGVQERFPEVEGFAQTAATTVSGLAQNLKENFAIFGATIIGLAEGPIKSFIGRVNEALGLAGQFVQGTGIFGEAPAGTGTRWSSTNPFAALAEQNRGAGPSDFISIPFEELPPEMQDILHERNGWGPNEGYVLAAEHAAELWDQLHPPSDLDQAVGILRQIRDVVFDFAKGVAVLGGLAGAFKLLGLALRLVSSPLFLISTAAGLLGIAFGRIYDASEPLRESLSKLRDTFGPLFDALRGFGGALLTGFFRMLGSSSTQTGLARVGNFLSGIVDALARGVGYLTGWLNWATEMINLDKGGEVLASMRRGLHSVNQEIGEFLGRIFGITPEEIAAKGGGIAGFLRNTFLEPVVNFFTDTLPRWAGWAIEHISDFFGGLVDAIFGGEAGGGTGAVGITPAPGRGQRVSAFLHSTFLDPVLDFFSGLGDVTGTIIGYITGFFGEIFGAWGGGGATQGAGGTGAVGITPAPDETENMLTTTFLDPIMHFFRETLPEAAGTIVGLISGFWDTLFSGGIGAGGGTGAVGITPAPGFGEGLLRPLIDSIMNFPAELDAAGWGEAASGVWDGLVESAQNIWSGGGDKGGGGVKGALDSMWAHVRNFFATLDWGSAISGATIAAAIGLALAGVPGLVVGLVVGLVTGNVGLFDPIVNEITSAWSTSIFPALTTLWGQITSWFANVFTYDNLKEAGLDVVGALYGIGEDIGAFFGSDEFQIGVAAAGGVAAAITVILASFASGLATGLSGAFLDWSNLFANFIEDAWVLAADKIVFIPDPIVAPLADVFGSATTGALGLAGLFVLGPALVRSIIGGITTFGPRLIAGAGGLFAMITGKKSPKQLGIQMSQDPNLKSVGAGIASGIAAGIGSFILGRAAGQTGSPGNIILALLTGGGAGAAIGFQLGGPIGAAVGGALGLAAAGVGAFFGNAERQARETREEVDRLADSLRGLFGAELTQSIEDQLRTALTTAAEGGAMEDWGQLMLDNFDFQGFADDLAKGMGDADIELVDVVENVKDQLTTQLTEHGGLPPEVAADVMNQLIEQMRIAAASGDFTSVTDLITAAFSQLPADVQQALGPTDLLSVILGSLGTGQAITTGDLQHILDLATDTGGKLRAAFEEIDTEDAVSGIDSVSEAVSRINEEITQGSTAQQIADILSQSELTSAESLQAVADVAGDVEDALNDAQQALVDFITGGTDQPATRQVILAQFTLDAAGMQEEADQLATETNAAVSRATATLNFQDFQDSLNETVSAAVEAGLITDPASFEQWKADLVAQVEATVTDPTTKARMLTSIEGLQMPTADLFSNLHVAQMTQDKIDEVAGIVRTGIEQALSQVTQSELTASVITNAGRSQGDVGINLDATPIGEAVGQTLTQGVVNEQANFADAVDHTIIDAFDRWGGGDKGNRSGGPGESAGRSQGQGLASGIGSTIGDAITAAQAINVGVIVTFASVASTMYNLGVNAGASFARGIGSQIAAAAQAAAAIAQAAINTAQAVLSIGSPSKVFANIGRDVGRGFIKGLTDSEGDMTEALATALENAIDRAIERAARKVNSAAVRGRVFDILAPSLLPGGTTDAARLADTLAQRANIAGFRGGLTQSASSALGGLGNQELYQARIDVSTIRSTFAESLRGIVETFNEAKGAQSAIATYDSNLATLNAEFKNGTLGWREYNEQVAAMKLQVKTGELSTEAYADRLKILNNQLKLGVLNTEAYNAALSDLGQRPAALTVEQQQILASGTRSLDPNVAAGQANREAIQSALESIRSWGQEALAAGQSLPKVLVQMREYRNQLISQLKSLGFNTTQIQQMVAAMGLSNEALAKFRAEMTSLNQATPEGAANAANLLDQFVSIREFGQRMLESGVPIANVIAQMKAFRNQIVAQAVAFGFNRKQIDALIKTVGLDNAALKDFIDQLARFEQEARNAEEAAKAAADAAAKKKAAEDAADKEKKDPANAPVAQPGVRDVHVHLPFGDPEAVALGVANRLAYDAVTAW